MRCTSVLLLLVLPALPLRAAVPPMFDVRAFGARELKKDDPERFSNTKAIARAIDEATRAATYRTTGSIVVVPKGRWLTGPIELRSNITLRIEEGATLVFSDAAEDDPPAELTRWEGVECVNYAGFIRARGAQNVAITGKGTIDGSGQWWWRAARVQAAARRRLLELAREHPDDPLRRVFAEPAQWPRDVFESSDRGRSDTQMLRPSFVQLIDCRNVRLEGFTIRNVPMYAIHPIYCEDVVCNDLRVVALGPDGAGVVADSCKRVTVENCVFDCYEDCVAVKSGRDADGRRVGRPSEDVTVRGCTFIRGASGVAVGSETSGSIRRVNVTRCQMKGVRRGLRIKTMRGRGGEIDDVKFTLCKLEEVGEAGVDIDMQLNPTKQEAFKGKDDQIPALRNVTIRGVESKGGWRPWLIRGLPERPIEGLNVVEVKHRGDRGIECRHVEGTQFIRNQVRAKEGWSLYAADVRDFRVERLELQAVPGKGPVIAVRDARSFTLSRTHAPEETDVFLRVAGKRSEDVTLEKCDTKNARHPVRVEDGAAEDVVMTKED